MTNHATKNFQSYYSKLNKSQRMAVDTIEGPVMVIAGPGTGKTQVLTLRIARILMATQINPENILALTFTENAAQEMRQRLSTHIGSDAYRVAIHTFHSFCNELIQKHHDIFQHLISFLPMSELDEIQSIESILESSKVSRLRPVGNPMYYIQPIKKTIRSLRKEGITSVQLKKIMSTWIGTVNKSKKDMRSQIEKTKEFISVYAQYQKKKRKDKLYDFDDMVSEVVHSFQKHSSFLDQIRETYQYILIDEHQDTNNLQNSLISYICESDDYPNLFVVGDEKQSIFRFQGASLENFLYFQKRFPRAHFITLEHNYRSTQKILDASYAFIQHNKLNMFPTSTLISQVNYPEVSIDLLQCKDTHHELSTVTAWVQRLVLKEHVAPDQICVLLRRNRDIQDLQEYFQKKQIPFTSSFQESLLDTLHIKKLITLLKAINYIGDDTFLIPALFLDFFAIDPLDIFLLIEKSKREKKSIWNILKTESSKNVCETSNKIRKWSSYAHNMSMSDFFVTVLEESMLLKNMLSHNNPLPILDKLHLMFMDIKQRERQDHAFGLDEYLNHVDLLHKHNISPRTVLSGPQEGSVYISTVHKAKGLEFQYVFIPYVIQSNWGSNRHKRSPIFIPWELISRISVQQNVDELMQEERRLFFVALTRAKKKIICSYSEKNNDGIHSVISPFIMEIPKKHVIHRTILEDKKKQIIRLTSHLSTTNDIKTTIRNDNIKQYIQSKFVKQGISVSALNNYIRCPWRFFFRNLIRLPDVKSHTLLLGTAIHETIKQYIYSIKKRKILTKKDIGQYYQDHVSRLALSDKELHLLEKKGSNILDAYFQKRMRFWNAEREPELVIPNLLLDHEIRVNGKIDMIEKSKKGYIVYDFKTGKTKSRNEILGLTKEKNTDYYRQLVFYKMLLSRYKNGLYQMSSGVIEFVESAIHGDVRSEYFEVKNSDVHVLIDEIKRMKDSVMHITFWNETCNDKTCSYCELRLSLQRSF